MYQVEKKTVLRGKSIPNVELTLISIRFTAQFIMVIHLFLESRETVSADDVILRHTGSGQLNGS